MSHRGGKELKLSFGRGAACSLSGLFKLEIALNQPKSARMAMPTTKIEKETYLLCMIKVALLIRLLPCELYL
jgi:hypothetical protein